MESQKTFVLSLGGSMVMPETVNIEFLEEFKTLLMDYLEKGYRFYIVVGGGRIARIYNEAAQRIAKPTTNDLDWIGIQATRLNAELVRTLFRDVAPEKIVYGKEDALLYKEFQIIVGGGWHPGGSSDMATVLLAKEGGAKQIINLSNVSFVYTADPKKDLSAEKIGDISWGDYRNIIPSDWQPGSNTPFDPIASKIAEEEGMSVAIMNGANLKNFRKFLDGESFEGTLIH